jgi:hypothetical protein
MNHVTVNKLSTTLWDIWVEGWDGGNASSAQKINAKPLASDTFDGAIQQFAKEHSGKASRFQKLTGGYWMRDGCGLWPDEATARRAAG